MLHAPESCHSPFDWCWCPQLYFRVCDLAGSQNHDGVLVIRATALSDDSTPARISRMAADAQVLGCVWVELVDVKSPWHAHVASAASHLCRRRP